jgi:hypothetical protein
MHTDTFRRTGSPQHHSVIFLMTLPLATVFQYNKHSVCKAVKELKITIDLQTSIAVNTASRRFVDWFSWHSGCCACTFYGVCVLKTWRFSCWTASSLKKLTGVQVLQIFFYGCIYTFMYFKAFLYKKDFKFRQTTNILHHNGCACPRIFVSLLVWIYSWLYGCVRTNACLRR